MSAETDADNTGNSEVLAFAKALAQRAGELIVDARSGQTLELSYKQGFELLTSADLQADELICAAIREKYPEHAILSEESSPDFSNAEKLRGPLWIIDPIDGTVNYAYNQHQVAISIAFAHDGKMRAGVVHCPFQSETFSAARGMGAFLNGVAIRTSDCSKLARALVGTGFPYDRDGRVALLERLHKVLYHCRDIRRIGAAAVDICWVAMGRLDVYYETINAWDFAAAALIAREAGARVGHVGPVPDGELEELWGRELVIATADIYDEFVALLRA
jgi:myo-inositol-1(or 4)-monophosphatase